MPNFFALERLRYLTSAPNKSPSFFADLVGLAVVVGLEVNALIGKGVLERGEVVTV